MAHHATTTIKRHHSLDGASLGCALRSFQTCREIHSQTPQKTKRTICAKADPHAYRIELKATTQQRQQQQQQQQQQQ